MGNQCRDDKTGVILFPFMGEVGGYYSNRTLLLG